MDRGAWWATVYGVAKSWTRLSDFTVFLSIVPFGEGNGNPLQCSCLENPMDRGAWWAIIHGVTESDMMERLNHHDQTERTGSRFTGAEITAPGSLNFLSLHYPQDTGSSPYTSS